MQDHILVPLHGSSEWPLRTQPMAYGGEATAIQAAHHPTALTEVP